MIKGLPELLVIEGFGVQCTDADSTVYCLCLSRSCYQKVRTQFTMYKECSLSSRSVHNHSMHVPICNPAAGYRLHENKLLAKTQALQTIFLNTF
jgi:hypothetical protein